MISRLKSGWLGFLKAFLLLLLSLAGTSHFWTMHLTIDVFFMFSVEEVNNDESWEMDGREKNCKNENRL